MTGTLEPRPALRSAALGAAAALVSGVLLWHGTGLRPLWWLTWLAPVPVLAWAFRASSRGAAGAACAAWALGGLNLLPYLRTTIGVPLPVALLAVALPAAVFSAGVLLSRRLAARGRPLAAALALPALWTAFELASSVLSPHGTFGSLAYTQLDFLPVAQLAAACGSAGIAFVLLLFATAAALATSPAAAGSRVRLAMLALAAPVSTSAFGLWRLADAPRDPVVIRVGLVAADHPEQPADPGTPEGRALAGLYSQAIRALVARGADVVVLPETVLRAANAAELAALAPEGGTPAIVAVGVDLLDPVASADGPAGERNAVVLLGGGQPPRAAYAKQHLLYPVEARYRAGTRGAVVAAGRARAGLAICKDLDFPSLGRAYARDGASLLLVPAWDFGEDGWLHSRMAILRGVEGGFAVARAARGGRLTLSDSRGRVLADLDSAAGPVVSTLARVEAAPPGTPYSVLGDAIASWLTPRAAPGSPAPAP